MNTNIEIVETLFFIYWNERFNIWNWQ